MHLKLCRYDCRLFIGANNSIVIADPDILREIMVKQFSKFTDKVCKG